MPGLSKRRKTTLSFLSPLFSGFPWPFFPTVNADRPLRDASLPEICRHMPCFDSCDARGGASESRVQALRVKRSSGGSSMRAHALLFCSLSLGILGAMAEAQTAGGQASPTTGQATPPKTFCKASDLIKYDVENDKGEDIGDVKDVLYDPVNERVAVVVVSYGGILGMGDKLYAVPWNAMTLPKD